MFMKLFQVLAKGILTAVDLVFFSKESNPTGDQADSHAEEIFSIGCSRCGKSNCRDSACFIFEQEVDERNSSHQ